MTPKKVLGACLALWVAGAATAGERAGETPPAPRAPGGVALLESMEHSGLGWVVRFAAVERLDARGYRATATVESVVGSPERTPQSIALAWEELSSQRAVRFAKGDRALVVLEPLGTASIWRTRIPDARSREQTAAVAARGEAFLRDPTIGAIDVLHHFLSLAPEHRDGPTGVGHLAALTAEARPALARDAARRLAAVPKLGEQLTAASAARLVTALAREDLGTSFEKLWGPTVAAARGETLDRALEQAVAASRPGRPPPPIYEAIGLASGGLPDDTVAALKDDPDVRYRTIVARTARDVPVLESLASSDPVPDVRSAALQRLDELGGANALPALLAALADPNAAVRNVAARATAARGDAAVPLLRSVVYGEYAAVAGSADAQRSAIAALGMAGSSGRRTLAEIAAEHPEESLRTLANIALGNLDTHDH